MTKWGVIGEVTLDGVDIRMGQDWLEEWFEDGEIPMGFCEDVSDFYSEKYPDVDVTVQIEPFDDTHECTVELLLRDDAGDEWCVLDNGVDYEQVVSYADEVWH